MRQGRYRYTPIDHCEIAEPEMTNIAHLQLPALVRLNLFVFAHLSHTRGKD